MNIIFFQFINYTLSFLMWMLIGRSMLKLIIGERENVFMALFDRVATPIHRLVQRVLPFAPAGWIPVMSIALIIAMRLLMVVFSLPEPKS